MTSSTEAVVAYDSTSRGRGHFRRAQFIKSLSASLGHHAVLQELTICGSDDCFGSCNEVLERHKNVGKLIVDSYKPANCFSAWSHEKSGASTMQIVDFAGQEIWAEYKIDPFSVLAEAPQTFQGLSYAVANLNSVPSHLLQPSQPKSGLLIATGSSSTPIHENLAELARLWPQITVISPHSQPPILPGSVNWVRPLGESDFLRLMRASQAVVSNCGVSGLQRLLLSCPGFSFCSESNQYDAAIALRELGVNVHFEPDPLVGQLLLGKPPQPEFLEVDRIGSGLVDVLREFYAG